MDISGVHGTETHNINISSEISLSGTGETHPRDSKMDTASRDSYDRKELVLRRIWAFSIAILIIGASIAIVFVVTGINALHQHRVLDFEARSQTVIRSISSAWSAYEVAGLMIHNSCRAKQTDRENYLSRGICSRSTFDDLYASFQFADLELEAISWVVNATQTDRIDLEMESTEYVHQQTSMFPENFTYMGFLGYEPDPSAKDGLSSRQRSVQDHYYVTHYFLPTSGFYAYAMDFDLNTIPSRREAIEYSLESSKPTLTEPGVLYGDEVDIMGNAVVLFHPGLPNTSSNELAMIVVHVLSILNRAIQVFENADCAIIIYDVTGPKQRQLVGGVEMMSLGESKNYYKTETELESFKKSNNLMFQETILVANRYWEVTVYGECAMKIVLLLMGGFIMFTACACLVIWYVTSARREYLLQEVQAATQAEKADLLVKNAKLEVNAERELNEFVSHEVRNPLAAALSACTFVSAACNENPPLRTEEVTTSVREDLFIICSSLSYINDLLRTMIDLHKAGNNRIAIDLVPLDLERDILAPAGAMLHKRGDDLEVIVECPSNLVVMTDRIRVKQIVLNLVNNARKFVTRGFIKVWAEVVNNQVHLYVEDSGTGIPVDKRKGLFDRYQQSLDVLQQGTGIGLSLCKQLCQLLNGDIWLDESYDSGMEGYPGTRFVVNLNAPPLNLEPSVLDRYEHAIDYSGNKEYSNHLNECQHQQLPDYRKVLFVDDDMILRKLFIRAILRVAPGWDVHEASNGETALEMVEAQEFDLIFVDMYMASIEKQLLGTETVRAMRSEGVRSIICGLSANDVESSFMNAGASLFLFKPLPCEKLPLTEVLLRILAMEQDIIP